MSSETCMLLLFKITIHLKPGRLHEEVERTVNKELQTHVLFPTIYTSVIRTRVMQSFCTP